MSDDLRGQAARPPFSEREIAVLQLMAEGLSNQEIADRQFLSLNTVKWYVRQINSKLDTHTRTQTVARARQLHLVEDGDTARVMQTEAREPPENPYKGLRAFQEADAGNYFGREKTIKRLLTHLGRRDVTVRFLAVIGPSGSGKSSVLHAGLIPALRRGEIPGSQHWLIAPIRPGRHPLEEVEVALLRLGTNPLLSLLPQLRDDERGLVRAARRVLPNDDSVLALVIDQFEEVFTLVENQAERQHFLDLLHEAATDDRSPLRIILTLRADFYDRPLLYPKFGALVQQHMEMIWPLTADELEQAITCPAERVSVTLEPELVGVMIAAVGQQPGALPLLQYALTEMFDHRQGGTLTLDAYQAVGGVTGALARRADALYEQLDAEGQAITRQLFLRMVTLGEGVEDTRRRVSQAELWSVGGTPTRTDKVIQTFAAFRLLTLDYDPATRQPTVELAHEAILREWTRLHGWLDESRTDIRMQRLLANAAAEWVHAERDAGFLMAGSRLAQFEEWGAATGLALTSDERAFIQESVAERELQGALEAQRRTREARLERRSRHFLRALMTVLLLATVGAFGLTGVAVNQSAIAQHNEAEARSLALAAQAQLALNEGNTDQAIAQAQTALQVAENTLARRILEQAAFAPGSPRIFHDLAGFVPRALTDQTAIPSFVIVSHGGIDEPFWLLAIRGMEDACALVSARCQWLGDEFFSPESMAGYWDAALAMNPDGIGTTVFDPAVIRRGVVRAAKRGIPVIALNAADPYAGTEQALPTLLYIGEDGFLSGRSNAWRVFAEAEADGATIERGVCGNQAMGFPPMDARCNGVESVFDEHGVPLDRIAVSTDPAETLVILTDYFADHPETNALFFLGPRPTLGFQLYLEQAGIEAGQLYAATHDTSEESFQMIRDGYLLQTIDQKPYMQGFHTIISLYLYSQYGHLPGGFINTSSVVDRSNVDVVAQLVERGYR